MKVNVVEQTREVRSDSYVVLLVEKEKGFGGCWPTNNAAFSFAFFCDVRSPRSERKKLGKLRGRKPMNS